ncbi:MAG: aminotransferase class III-fold pyridoxal phosphate-dependent enzyme [Boseongicola sp.]|nr:MAG: aminotransferase class III-fold pyridoxal phosphate-dependent enzyme [Boseongicola sp.]
MLDAARTNKSARLFERAKKVMPGGCSRNTILRKPHPVYAEKGQGCFVTDIEGVRRIDFANNVASLIHGHAHPAIVEGVKPHLEKGSAFSVGTEIEVDYAEQLVARCPSFEKIRFVNSGTEAVMSCLKAARSFTGRAKIAKVEGSYHGLYDYAEVSQTANPSNWGAFDAPNSVPVAFGTPQSALDDVVVIPFNDAERAIAILDANKDSIAGVLLDLLPHRIGVIPASDDFVEALRKWSTENDALLIFDEVITFRTEFSGAQQLYSVQPDLTALGKMIGGGFPVGAIAGRSDVLEVMNPLNGPAKFPHYGTFSANPVTLTAGSIAMSMFDEDAVLRLNALADYARSSIGEAIKVADVPCCVTGRGSMFRIHLCVTPPTTYRNAFVHPAQQKCLSVLLDHFFDHGLIMVETCSGLLSTPMTSAEIDHLAQTALDGFRKIKPML